MIYIEPLIFLKQNITSQSYATFSYNGKVVPLMFIFNHKPIFGHL